MLFDPGEFFVADQRRRAISAHAAGVRTEVAVVGRLVVLGRLQGDDRAAVGDGQDARLFAVEPFFDHQPVAGRAEYLLTAICSTARIASSRWEQTITPLPAASPSALTTIRSSLRSLR